MTPTSPAAEPICPRCGAPLAPTAAGLCARCMMADIMRPTGERDRSEWIEPPTAEELAPEFPALEILECLGRGGMGVVYKARQKSLNRLVALKLLAPEKADDPAFAERFAKEARTLATLTHPNIVAVHDFGKSGHYYYLLMEYVDGTNLRALITSHKLSPREALSIVPPICDALQCAHDRGIVHRDIKPENILLDKSGVVKIADFGIAKILASANETEPATGSQQTESSSGVQSLPFGTPAYAAPEQRAGSDLIDPRADIYSLGVVLYEMLTGELPAEKLSVPSRKVQIDVRLDEVVLKALEQTPELRFQTVAEFKTRIENIATKPLTPSATTPVQILPWRERWSWDTANLAAASLVVCLLLMAIVPWLPAAINGRLTVYVLIALAGFLAIYGGVCWRVRSLKADLASTDAEVCEALIFRRPFQAPGIAALHRDRLDLFPILGRPIIIDFQDIRSLNEVRWFNGSFLIGKRGFIMELKNARRVGVAVPESIASRWRFILSRGALPQEPSLQQARPNSHAREGQRSGCWGCALTALLVLGILLVVALLARWNPAQKFNALANPARSTEIEHAHSNGTTLTSPQEPYFPKKLDPAILAEKPQLRFLAWQDEGVDSNYKKAWHPDGTVVLDPAELKLLRSSVPTRVSVGGSAEGKLNPRFLTLWFSHPGADTNSYSKVTFSDVDGKPLPTSGTFSSGGRSPGDLSLDEGWIIQTISPVRVGHIPDSIRIRLQYTVGRWGSSSQVEPDYNGTMAFGDRGMLGSMGSWMRGGSFLSISYALPNENQYDAYALLKDGHKLAHRSVSTSGNGTLENQTYTFDSNMDHVMAFQIRQRRIQTAEFDHVVLRP